VGGDGGGLQRHFGLLQATALNVTMIVGAGVFITIPYMLTKLPGPYALLGWIGAGALMVVDGLVWSELGATLPGSGGSYLYLLECYGRERWGRLMAFLFIWQFLISGPLEVASGLIAIAQFSNDLTPWFRAFNEAHSWRWVIYAYTDPWTGDPNEIAVGIGPARLGAFCLGVLLLFLLYRRITVLGRLTVTFWLGVLAIIGWILVEGLARFSPAVAFEPPPELPTPLGFAKGLGQAMILAMYSYLGYYNVCYIGDEVRDPARTIPRAILLSAVLVCVLFVGLHLALMGTVPWTSVPVHDREALDNYNLPSEFMRRLHGDGAAGVIAVCLIWSCLGSAFAALLGYSRIPYGAARVGHFFAPLARIHPVHAIPHVSLLLVGGLTLFWSFFDLQSVINALITTRIVEQFIGQIVGVVLLRVRQPDRPRPFRIWLYPVPCGVALVGWLWLYVAAGPVYIGLGLVTLSAGAGVFLLWARRTASWPFQATVA
jgi:amino acid transporter